MIYKSDRARRGFFWCVGVLNFKNSFIFLRITNQLLSLRYHSTMHPVYIIIVFKGRFEHCSVLKKTMLPLAATYLLLP